jgi:hypothetical protein
MAKKEYTSGELFGAAVPSDIKGIFKKKEKCIEDVLSKKDAKGFESIIDELHYMVRKNYPAEEIIEWLESANAYKEKIKKVL